MNRLRLPYIIGIDIGGTKVAVSYCLRQGKVLQRRVYPTLDTTSTLAQVKQTIGEYLAEYDPKVKQTQGIGISCAGPLDLKKGILLNPPNMLSWRNVPLKRIFTRAFGLAVVLDNDANAAALAEKTFGAGQRVQDLFYYTVSTGIGGGLIVAGRVHHGASSDAGEIGHTVILPGGPQCNCGKRGCLEALASGTAIARIAREKAGKSSLILKLAGKRENINAQVVAQAALKKDKLARAIFDQVALYLGISIANVIQTINPEMVIIGGGVSKVGGLLFKPLRRYVARFTWSRPLRSCQIVPAALKDEVGDLGAISLLLKKDK